MGSASPRYVLYIANYPCILDYQSKFPVIKNIEGLSTDDLRLACQYFSSEFGLSNKIISDADGNFISERFKKLCKKN